MASIVRKRTTFDEEELIPGNLESVYCQEKLARNRRRTTAFPISAEHERHLQRRGILFHIVQQLRFWCNRYTHRLWQYFEE